MVLGSYRDPMPTVGTVARAGVGHIFFEQRTEASLSMRSAGVRDWDHSPMVVQDCGAVDARPCARMVLIYTNGAEHRVFVYEPAVVLVGFRGPCHRVWAWLSPHA